MWKIFGSSSSTASPAEPAAENVFGKDGLVDTDDGDEWIKDALSEPKPALSSVKRTSPVTSRQNSGAFVAPGRPAGTNSVPQLSPVSNIGVQTAPTSGLASFPQAPPRTELGDPIPGFPAAPKAARYGRTRMEPSNWAVSGPSSAPSLLNVAPGLNSTPGTIRISSERLVDDRVFLTAPGEKTVFDLAGLSGPSDATPAMRPNTPIGSSFASSTSSLPSSSSLAVPSQTEDPLAVFSSTPSKPFREIRPPAMEALFSALEDHDWGMDVDPSAVDGENGNGNGMPKKKVQTKSEVLRSLQDTLSKSDKISYLRLIRLLARESRHHPTHPSMPPSSLSKSSLRKVLKTLAGARTRYTLYVQRTEEKLALYLDLADDERELAESGGDAKLVAEELIRPLQTPSVDKNEGMEVEEESGAELTADGEGSDETGHVEEVQVALDKADENDPFSEPGSPSLPTPAEVQDNDPFSDPAKPTETAAPSAPDNDPFSGLDSLSSPNPASDPEPQPTSPHTPLTTDPRQAILSHFFLLSVADGLGYPPAARVLLRLLATRLNMDSYDVVRIEAGLSAQLGIFVSEEDEGVKMDGEADRLIRERERRERVKRWAVTALAFAGGGALIGLSAGVMAPLIGAGVSATLGMVGVGGTAGFLGSTAGAAVIAASGASVGGALSAQKMAKRTGRLGTFELLPVRPAYVAAEDAYIPLSYPSVTICVSGWLTEGESDFHAPWSTVSPGALGELHTLRWDPSDLINLGSAFRIIASEVISFGVTQVLGATVLGALMAGITLPMWVAKLGYALDNPWGIGLSKAKKAGLVLADSLIAQVQGHRPVTLVGFSLGARVVFYCLLELAQRGYTELVEDAVLIGAPVMATEVEWIQCVAAVSGRVVNGYLPGDWVLGLLYRASTATFSKVAGLHAIEGVDGLENLDLTGMCEGHLKYRVRMPRILDKLGIKVWREWIDEDDEEERRLVEEARREGRVLEQAPPPVPASASPLAAASAGTEADGKSKLWNWGDIMELKRIQDQMEGYFEPKDLGASSLPPLVITKEMLLDDGIIDGTNGESSSSADGPTEADAPQPDRSGLRLAMDELSDDEDEDRSTTSRSREGSVSVKSPVVEEMSRLDEDESEGGAVIDEVDLAADENDVPVSALSLAGVVDAALETSGDIDVPLTDEDRLAAEETAEVEDEKPASRKSAESTQPQGNDNAEEGRQD